MGAHRFLIIMIDIDQTLIMSAMSGSFTDYTWLWQVINAMHRTNTLQKQLQHLYNWRDQSNVQFNSDKFEPMWYGKTDDKLHYVTQEGLKLKKCIKDLGVLMSLMLNLMCIIKNTAATGHSMAGWILRSFKPRAIHHTLMLLKTLIISQMKCCCPLWSPTDMYSQHSTPRKSPMKIHKLICSIPYL